MPHGQIGYIEVYSRDLAESKTFYERAFGWKFGETMGPDYQMFEDPTGNVGGGVGPQAAKWTAPDGGAHLYVTVDSIEKSLAAIEEAGGATLKGKTVIDPSIGWWASFKDPSGNELGIYETAQK